MSWLYIGTGAGTHACIAYKSACTETQEINDLNKVTELNGKNREQVNYILGGRVQPTIFTITNLYPVLPERKIIHHYVHHPQNDTKMKNICCKPYLGVLFYSQIYPFALSPTLFIYTYKIGAKSQPKKPLFLSLQFITLPRPKIKNKGK
jgi:hypothetical protein